VSLRVRGISLDTYTFGTWSLAGILALVYPVVSSVGVVFLVGWLLIISGVVQGISLVDVRNVPHFWLQLVSVVCL
jgi:uncharacterized membrane protein HdeD (DUF308 family)